MVCANNLDEIGRQVMSDTDWFTIFKHSLDEMGIPVIGYDPDNAATKPLYWLVEGA